MRILIATMLGFNDAFRFSHQDQTAGLLAHSGHEVLAYAYLDKKNSLNSRVTEMRDSVKVKRFPPPHRKGISLKLRNALREDGPFDIIHLHHLRNDFSFEVTKYSTMGNIPLIFEPHGLLHDPHLVKNRDFPFSAPLLENNPAMLNSPRFIPLKNARILISLSEHEKGLLSRITGRSDIEIIPHWIDRTSIGSAKTDFPGFHNFAPIILFVGQLKYRRGFDIAVKAFSRVKREFPGAALVIVTNNTDKKPALLSLARRENVARDIVFKENISEEEKFSLYRCADIYLSPTRYEGFGVTFLEAMASGCPVVASSIPVVDEIIEDGQTGMLARLEDPCDFYKKIKRLLTDTALREKIVKNGLQKVEKDYNKEKIFGKLLSIYDKLTT